MVLKKAFQRYLDILKTHPYTTNIMTSSVLMLTGDMFIQNFEIQENYLNRVDRSNTECCHNNNNNNNNDDNNNDNNNGSNSNTRDVADSADSLHYFDNDILGDKIMYPGGLITIKNKNAVHELELDHSVDHIVELSHPPTMINSDENVQTLQSSIEYYKQRLNFSLEHVNLSRTLVMCSWTACCSAPMFTTWFRYADILIPGKSVGIVLAKSVATVFGVAFPMNAGFFAYVTTVEKLLAFPVKKRQRDHSYNEEISTKPDYNFHNERDDENSLISREIKSISWAANENIQGSVSISGKCINDECNDLYICDYCSCMEHNGNQIIKKVLLSEDIAADDFDENNTSHNDNED
eukprot:Pgem_evm1s4454